MLGQGILSGLFWGGNWPPALLPRERSCLMEALGEGQGQPRARTGQDGSEPLCRGRGVHLGSDQVRDTGSAHPHSRLEKGTSQGIQFRWIPGWAGTEGRCPDPWEATGGLVPQAMGWEQRPGEDGRAGGRMHPRGGRERQSSQRSPWPCSRPAEKGHQILPPHGTQPQSQCGLHSRVAVPSILSLFPAWAMEASYAGRSRGQRIFLPLSHRFRGQGLPGPSQ